MTRIPQLEEELVAAAARLRSRRRRAWPVARAALAAAALVAAVVLTLVVTAENDPDRGSTHPADTQGGPFAKVAFDRDAGVGFGLEGRTLTVSLYPLAPGKSRNRLNGARIRATCGQGFTGGQGDPRQERTRLWPVGSDQVRFHFRRDISRIARWCRLENPVVGHVAFVKFGGAALAKEQRVERIAGSWARLFAADARNCKYEGQPLCERIGCERPGHRPIRNCTRPSVEFRDSFRDATVEKIAIRGNRAAAKFSNGETIELGEDVSGFEHDVDWWWVTKVGGNAGRGFFEQ